MPNKPNSVGRDVNGRRIIHVAEMTVTEFRERVDMDPDHPNTKAIKERLIGAQEHRQNNSKHPRDVSVNLFTRPDLPGKMVRAISIFGPGYGFVPIAIVCEVDGLV